MLLVLPLELRTYQGTSRAPLANYAILAANLVVYATTVLFGWSWPVGRGTGLASILLYAFSHAGFWHLAFNLWTLYVFGNAINRRIGNCFYALAYLGAALAVGLVARIFVEGRVLGSSGAIFAILMLALFLLPAARLTVGYVAIIPVTILLGLLRRPKYPIYWLVRWGEFSAQCLWCLILIPCLQLWSLIWNGWQLSTLGHLLGMVCGVILVLLLPSRITLARSSPARAEAAVW